MSGKSEAPALPVKGSDLSSDKTPWQARRQVPGQVPGETRDRKGPPTKMKPLSSKCSPQSTEEVEEEGMGRIPSQATFTDSQNNAGEASLRVRS